MFIVIKRQGSGSRCYYYREWKGCNLKQPYKSPKALANAGAFLLPKNQLCSTVAKYNRICIISRI